MPTLDEFNAAVQKHLIADIKDVDLDSVTWHPNMAIIYGMAYAMLHFQDGGISLSDEWDKFQSPVRNYNFERLKISKDSTRENRIIADALDLLRHMTRDQMIVTMHCLRVMLYADPGETFYLANPTRFAEYIQAMKDLRVFKGYRPFVCTRCHKVHDMVREYNIMMRNQELSGRFFYSVVFNSCNMWECAACFQTTRDAH